MSDFLICVDCRSEIDEKSLPDYSDVSPGWSYSCPSCGGKIIAYEIPESEDIAKVKEQIRNHMDSDRFGTVSDAPEEGE